MPHPLIGLDVRVRTSLNSPRGASFFTGVVIDVQPPYFTVMRSDDGSVGVWWQDTVTFVDPEHAAHMLRAPTATQDVTTDGRTLSQVCTELVEAKQTAARLNDALQDLAVELDLPMGLPENSILEAIRVKVFKLRERSLND